MPILLLFRLPEGVYKDITIVLVGCFTHWMLYGVLLAQVCLYYTSFPNDHRLLKVTVLIEFVLETIQTTMITQDVYRGLVPGFENPLLVNEIGTVWISVPLITGLIALIARIFYCYRAAILTKSRCAVALIAVLAVTQFGSSGAVAMQARAAGLITNLLRTRINVITVGIWGASDVSCDTTTAAIMVYYLKKRDTGFRATHNIIKRLIRLTIETGLITASFSVVSIILAYIPGHPLYFQIAILIVAKLYSNSMLAALNSRMRVVSNSPFGSPPSWNESIEITDSFRSEFTQEIAFQMDGSVTTVEERT